MKHVKAWFFQQEQQQQPQLSNDILLNVVMSRRAPPRHLRCRHARLRWRGIAVANLQRFTQLPRVRQPRHEKAYNKAQQRQEERDTLQVLRPPKGRHNPQFNPRHREVVRHEGD